MTKPGGPAIDPPVADFLNCITGSKHYEWKWLAVYKVIAII